MKLFCRILHLGFDRNKPNTSPKHYKKRTLFFLTFLLSSFAYGQLPIRVDNSRFFPPVLNQESVPDCSHIALIRNLKSSIWNAYYGRDPKAPANIFSHTFVWNQNMHPDYKTSDVADAFYFMKSQGDCSVIDFANNEQSTEDRPTFEARAKALSYKSKRLFRGWFNYGSGGKKEEIIAKLESLKDSLSQGKNFVLSFRLFPSIFKMEGKKNVYSCYGESTYDSIMPGHALVIVGYNDTIKTAKGRGAFQALDSSDKTENGMFWFDYNWFILSPNLNFPYYFLEEDFSSQEPKQKAAINLKLSSTISGSDLYAGNFTFTDTIIKYQNRDVDFGTSYDYLYNRSQVQVISLNHKRLKLRSNLVLMPFNSTDGSYNLVADLGSADNFQSASIIVFDPISSEYKDRDGNVVYSYVRQANCKVDEALLAGVNKQVTVKIVDLPDTTIVSRNFYSYTAGWHLKPQQSDFWTSTCVSVLKRKLITFTVPNSAPEFTVVPTLQAYTNKTLSYQFEAQDMENDPITFTLANNLSEASITPAGYLTFKSAKIGTYKFTVVASDGKDSSTSPVTVIVDFDTDAETTSAIPSDLELKVFPNPMASNVTVEFSLPKEGTANLGIFNSLGQQIDVIANQKYSAGKHQLIFDGKALPNGIYMGALQTSGGTKTIKMVKNSR